MSHLPETWQTADLESLGRLFCGQSPSTADVNKEGKGTPYVTGPEQWDGRKILLHKWTTSPKRTVPDGCIFITVKGAGVGTLFPGVPCVIGRDIYAFKPHPSLDKRFFELALRFTIEGIIRQAKGDIPGLSKNQIFDHEIGIPPTAEQRRIVAKIEELFSELDEGIENLKQARAQLAVYRQALLKHAFEGKLTADWRAAHADQLESAVEGSTDDLRQLPTGWLWQRLGDISVVSGGLTKNPKRESLPGKMKYLRVANVYADRLDLDDVREIGVTEDEARRLVLEKGDLLVVEGNGSIDQIGRVAEWAGSIQECGHQNHLIRARFSAAVLPRFALRFLQSPRGRDAIVKAASSTSGLHTLSISKVANLSIPVAPLPEQEALLSLIEPAFDYIAALETDIDANLQKAEALRQSILKKAFAGELVPQDPADLPAAVLLAGIRAAKAKEPKARPVRSRAPKSETAETALP